MGAWREVRQLTKVNKTKSAYYLFKEVEINGKSFIEMREHFDRIDGSTQHTTKGITIPINVFADVAEGFAIAWHKYSEQV